MRDALPPRLKGNVDIGLVTILDTFPESLDDLEVLLVRGSKLAVLEDGIKQRGDGQSVECPNHLPASGMLFRIFLATLGVSHLNLTKVPAKFLINPVPSVFEAMETLMGPRRVNPIFPN